MEGYKLQETSVWSFPERGSWLTHNPSYRGNWSPHIPRNLILKYSKEKETVLDMFIGGGTTLIESKVLNRKGIGVDINQEALMISKKNLEFNCEYNTEEQELILGDATNLVFIENKSIDLICSHPPYFNIIKYGDLKEDLSNLDLHKFEQSLVKVALECFRVLKENKMCCIMIGDIRKNKEVYPLGFKLMSIFQSVGFNLKEIIIKEQFNCKSTHFWTSKKRDFYLLKHEYIFIFTKKKSIV